MDKKLQQRLYILVILVGLIPTIAILGWGVYKSVQSSEFQHPQWVQQ